MNDETPEAEPQNKQEARPDLLEQLQSELNECKDKYLRSLAESDNMRKRLQKEKQEMMQYAVSEIVAEFLGPIDHMENALKHTQNMSEDVKLWSLGFQMILTQFKDVLANNGIQTIESLGSAFDPHLHEAVETEPKEGVVSGIILEEFVRGYKMGEKIIRPARVKVAK
jgi:molecular chaperone GrpE